MIEPYPQPLTEEQVREFRDALAALYSDPAWRHKVIILPPGRVPPPPAGPLEAVSDLCLTPPGAGP